MNAARIALMLSFVILSAVLCAGCGHKRGRQVTAGAGHNFVVDNDSRFHSVTVYVDDGKLGTVEDESLGHFYVQPGIYPVHLREGNDLNPKLYAGHYEFRNDAVVTVRHSD